MSNTQDEYLKRQAAMKRAEYERGVRNSAKVAERDAHELPCDCPIVSCTTAREIRFSILALLDAPEVKP